MNSSIPLGMSVVLRQRRIQIKRMVATVLATYNILHHVGNALYGNRNDHEVNVRQNNAQNRNDNHGVRGVLWVYYT